MAAKLPSKAIAAAALAADRPPRAFAYSRFSTPEQASGSSKRRQDEAAERYARERNLILDDETRFLDEGVSAFKRLNVLKGALGRFLKMIEDGEVGSGDFLLIENFDRLSRDTPLDALPIVLLILNAGVTIVTLDDGQEFEREALRKDSMKLILIIVVMMRAHNESATKSNRSRDNWTRKRKASAEGKRIVTRRCPAWVRPLPDESGFVLNEQRAKVVRRIFAETLAGKGSRQIEAGLNRDGVPVFGEGKRVALHWHRTYVRKILDSRAVIGEFQPHRREIGEDGRKVRVPDGDPIKNYFPPVISKEDFDAVQAERETAQPSAHADKPVRNIFAGVGKCPKCQRAMTLQSKGPRGGRATLICSRAKASAGCDPHRVPYDLLEGVVTGHFRELIDGAPRGDDLGAERDELAKRRKAAEAAVYDVMVLLGEHGFSRALSEKLRECEAERDRAVAEWNAFARRAEVAGKGSVLKRLKDLEKELRRGQHWHEPNRPLIASLLRQLCSAIVIDWSASRLRFQWLAGGETFLSFAPRQEPPLEAIGVSAGVPETPHTKEEAIALAQSRALAGTVKRVMAKRTRRKG